MGEALEINWMLFNQLSFFLWGELELVNYYTHIK